MQLRAYQTIGNITVKCAVVEELRQQRGGGDGEVQLLEAQAARAVRVQRHQQVLAREAVQLPL